MVGWLRPRVELDAEETRRGLRLLLLDGVFTEAMGALTGGALLVAFALQLGASNTVIGVIAAVGPLTKVLQLPATLLVEKARTRKLLVVSGLLVRRLLWLGIAALPWLLPESMRVAGLVAALVVYFGVGSISSCALSSWVKDLVPDRVVGRYFASRLTAATAVGAALTLAAGFAVDAGTTVFAEATTAYSLVFVLGLLFGLAGVAAIARMPEPAMAPAADVGLLSLLREPLRDTNFRNLLVFLGSWNLAVNLAAPFFTVYMLTRLGLPMSWVLGLAVASQVVNLVFFRIWGRLADRFSNKSVLGVAGWLFVLSIVLWPFTTMPDRHVLTIPLLVAIHLLTGISTAGVNLCSSGIAVKLAPRGKATAFLATNALVSGAAATLAPVAAGLAADMFVGEALTVRVSWMADEQTVRFLLEALSLHGLDFLFVIAALVGLYALHRLVAVREEGEVADEVIVGEVLGEVMRTARHVSNVAGLHRLSHFPYSRLRRANDDHGRHAGCSGPDP
jgi:MFS family permease